MVAYEAAVQFVPDNFENVTRARLLSEFKKTIAAGRNNKRQTAVARPKRVAKALAAGKFTFGYTFIL